MAVLKAEDPVKLTTTSVSDAASLGTPSKADPRIQMQGSSCQGKQDTPIKGLKTAQVMPCASSSLVGNENDECIYQRLGWNDDADELM